jgi:hypothetical protein
MKSVSAKKYDHELIIHSLSLRLRAVPPYRGLRFPGMRKKGGTADNISRNEIRVAHTTKKFPLVEIDTPVNQV